MNSASDRCVSGCSRFVSFSTRASDLVLPAGVCSRPTSVFRGYAGLKPRTGNSRHLSRVLLTPPSPGPRERPFAAAVSERECARAPKAPRSGPRSRPTSRALSQPAPPCPRQPQSLLPAQAPNLRRRSTDCGRWHQPHFLIVFFRGSA